ncbi:cation:proton antiporter [Arenibacterium sp. CAU 1754]
MHENAIALMSLGGLFLAGLAADQLGHKTRLPRVTLLLCCGLLAGGAGFDLLPQTVTELYNIVSIIALTMVAFLLGGALSLGTLREHGRAIIYISLAIVIFTQIIVATGLWLLGLPLTPALVLGAIAGATAPATTYDVIRQLGVKNGFTRTLKGIVAIDDAWGLILFSLAIVAVQSWEGVGGEHSVLLNSLMEIAGSVALGLVIGLPAAFLTGRLSDGEPLRIEALGLVFFTAGLSLWLDLSYLISGMTVGVVIVNVARHHTRAFHEIENIQWPFMVIFFILAGATLDAESLWVIGPMGAAYVLLRVLARGLGGWIGSALAGSPAHERPWFGPALIPQAGVAIGMALIAAEQLPDQGAFIMALTVGSTVVFELVGPLATSFAIRRVAAAEATGDQSAS